MPLFLTWARNNIQLIIIAAAWAAMFFIGFGLGDSHVRKQWDKSIMDAQASATQKEHAINATSNEAGNELQKRFHDIDSVYESNLVSMLAPGRRVSATTGSTSGPNAAACVTGLSRQDKTLVARLSHDADIQTTQLVYWQQWYVALHDKYNQK